MVPNHQGQELNGLNSAIDSATVDFSQGALQLVVSETERAAKDQQDGAIYGAIYSEKWGSSTTKTDGDLRGNHGDIEIYGWKMMRDGCRFHGILSVKLASAAYWED